MEEEKNNLSEEVNDTESNNSEEVNEVKEEAKEEAKEKIETAAGDDSENDSDKKNYTIIIIEAIIAVLAVGFVVFVLLKNNSNTEGSVSSSSVSGADASANMIPGMTDMGAAVDNSVFYENLPAMTDVSELNTLTEEECQARVDAGTMIKLECSDGSYVYVNNFTDMDALSVSLNYTQEEFDTILYNDLLSYYTSIEAPEDYTICADGDVVNINYEGKIDGVAFEGGTATDQLLELGSGTMIPGFEEGIIGMEEGEIKDINVTFPENYGNDLAGKDAVFTISLNSIVYTKDENPELTDAIVQECFTDISTVSECEAYYVQAIKNSKANDFLSDGFYVSAISEETANNYYNSTIDNFAMMCTYYGIGISDMLVQYGTDIDTFKADVMRESCHSARFVVLYTAIAEYAGIEITDVDRQELAFDYGYDSLETFYAEYGEDIVDEYLLNKLVIEYISGLVDDTAAAE